jgi:hypothetical protein
MLPVSPMNILALGQLNIKKITDNKINIIDTSNIACVLLV